MAETLRQFWELSGRVGRLSLASDVAPRPVAWWSLPHPRASLRGSSSLPLRLYRRFPGATHWQLPARAEGLEAWRGLQPSTPTSVRGDASHQRLRNSLRWLRTWEA